MCSSKVKIIIKEMKEKWAEILCTLNRENSTEHCVLGKNEVYDLYDCELQVCISKQY